MLRRLSRGLDRNNETGTLSIRLGHFTGDSPKSLVGIGTKLFLVYRLEVLCQEAMDVAICLGHLSRQLEDYFDDSIKFVRRSCPTSV